MDIRAVGLRWHLHGLRRLRMTALRARPSPADVAQHDVVIRAVVLSPGAHLVYPLSMHPDDVASRPG